MSPSITSLIVALHVWPFQIPLLRFPRPYARKAAVPATRNTTGYCAPGGTVRPVRYATKSPTTRQKPNHIARNFGMAGGPLRKMVMVPTGPCLYFSVIAGDFLSLGVAKGKT